MHIGSGEELVGRVADPENAEGGKEAAVSAVVTDAGGKPFIPGSSLRGCLRSWMEGAVDDPTLIHSIWGTAEKDREQGGKVYVRGATFNRSRSTPPSFPEPPPDAESESSHVPRHWNENRWTQIEYGVSIDRFTGTAARHRLYYFETVPAGAVFNVVVDAVELTDEELAWVMASLDALNLSLPLCRLGAYKNNGYGKCQWHRKALTGLTTAEHRKQWLDAKSRPAGFQGYPELDADFERQLPPIPSSADPSVLAIKIEIQFDGPMLVNDPSRLFRQVNGEFREVNHGFVTDEKDRVLLPSRSVRGVLRSHAERILRTMGDIGDDRLTPDDLQSLACYLHESKLACKPVNDRSEIETCCVACRLFGLGGWRSPVWIENFEEQTAFSAYVQEFVAVDRFTGGAAHQKKFNAMPADRPKFSGLIAIELNRLETPHLGLLSLLLRDWIEGDIRFGYGAGKGYGRCTARITEIIPPETWARQWVPEEEDLKKTKTGQAPSLTEAMQTAVVGCIRELEDCIRQFRTEVSHG